MKCSTRCIFASVLGALYGWTLPHVLSSNHIQCLVIHILLDWINHLSVYGRIFFVVVDSMELIHLLLSVDEENKRCWSRSCSGRLWIKIIKVCFCSWCLWSDHSKYRSHFGVHLVSELVVVGYALWTCEVLLKFLVFCSCEKSYDVAMSSELVAWMFRDEGMKFGSWNYDVRCASVVLDTWRNFGSLSYSPEFLIFGIVT